MATLDTDEANIVDVEDFNWRAVVYPLLLALAIVVGGLFYYYYQLEQREEMEAAARTALLKAKTPEEWTKVADQYPASTQATLALMKAADASFTKRDYAAASADYQRIIQATSTDAELRDSAQLGLASCLEANGKADDAITANLEVAMRGAKSPYAPFAYFSAARLYEEKGDKENQRKYLTEAAGLDPDSNFVKQAQQKLKEMTAAEQPMKATITQEPTPPGSAVAKPSGTSAPASVSPAAK